MHKILEEILNKTRKDLLKRKKEKPLSDLSRKVQPFLAKSGKMAIIAEVKLASPSEKNLGSVKGVISRVKKYQKGGADAVSIVTEKHFFNGDPEFIAKIKNAVSLPILQKDFVIDPYQLYESKKAGADAILLIARILSAKELTFLVKEAQRIGLEPVLEINSRADLKKAVITSTKIIAVNARDLDTFKVDVEKACELLMKVPNKYIKLGFSGVLGKDEVEKYRKAGAAGILIGTSLMKTGNISKFLEGIRSPRIKICGIRSAKTARVAVSAGADYLGFNFVPTSKRYIDPENAKKIIRGLKGRVKVVGVFQDSDISEVNELATELGLDFVQLHGSEDDNYISKVKIPVIKAVTGSSKPNGIKAQYLLIDREKRGEGKMVDPVKAKQLTLKYEIFLAGGLTPDNVVGAVQNVQPFAVDVAGGVETNGVTDNNKIRRFIKNARLAAKQAKGEK